MCSTFHHMAHPLEFPALGIFWNFGLICNDDYVLDQIHISTHVMNLFCNLWQNCCIRERKKNQNSAFPIISLNFTSCRIKLVWVDKYFQDFGKQQVIVFYWFCLITGIIAGIKQALSLFYELLLGSINIEMRANVEFCKIKVLPAFE